MCGSHLSHLDPEFVIYPRDSLSISGPTNKQNLEMGLRPYQCVQCSSLGVFLGGIVLFAHLAAVSIPPRYGHPKAGTSLKDGQIKTFGVEV